MVISGARSPDVTPHCQIEVYFWKATRIGLPYWAAAISHTDGTYILLECHVTANQAQHIPTILPGLASHVSQIHAKEKL